VALAEAARSDSSATDVYLALANLYRARGEIGRAIQIHQNLLLRPELPAPLRGEALLGLALDFRAGGFLRRSRASFEELLEQEPRNLQALRELERIHVESGEWEQAIGVRKRIGSADPRTPQILAHLFVGLGRAHAREGREAEAQRAFKRALGHDRHCAEAHVTLGDQALRGGKAGRAIGYWRRALPLHPASGRVLYPRLFEAFGATRDASGFERLLRDRLEQAPDDPEAALWLARALVRAGSADAGLEVLRRLLERRPELLAAHAEVGRILVREHRDFEALKAFEELLERLPIERPKLRCRSCGTQDSDLHWRCPQCGEWDSFA
jgi:lipopolysaccharide biosynthesis regulator YciM